MAHGLGSTSNIRRVLWICRMRGFRRRWLWLQLWLQLRLRLRLRLRLQLCL